MPHCLMPPIRPKRGWHMAEAAKSNAIRALPASPKTTSLSLA